MVFEQVTEGILLRVRLSPNSSCCFCSGIWVNAEGTEFLKTGVTEVPEKGKANAALIKLLAKQFKVAKSAVKLISGETDRCKKVMVSGDSRKLGAAAEELSQKER